MRAGDDQLAEGIAAHLLNPSTKLPSLWALLIERHLLLKAAQAAFPGEGFNGENHVELSEKGRRIKKGVENLLAREDKETQGNALVRFFKKGITHLCRGKEKHEYSLLDFLVEYQPKHKAVYKSLACMELNQLAKDPEHWNKDKLTVKYPRVLTLKFSARGYTGMLEASDGLVVEMTEAIEISITRAQRWSRSSKHNSLNLFDRFDLLITVNQLH
ncbi:hypothetical protein SUGI_1133370 [Cryptomeria japonica]|nr:hypothetical protein SUGI_1133370 [Cryptomeria japonica]